jgi:hypothetical protein
MQRMVSCFFFQIRLSENSRLLNLCSRLTMLRTLISDIRLLFHPHASIHLVFLDHIIRGDENEISFAPSPISPLFASSRFTERFAIDLP